MKALPSKLTRPKNDEAKGDAAKERRSAWHALKKGMAVLMEDGWRGRVEQDGAEIIICIADEERPNDYFRGYRGFATGT
jgi:hypothetical protein